MGIYNFQIDLPNAEKIADLLEKLLQKFGYVTERAPNQYFPDWDIKAVHPITRKVLTFEVKFDEKCKETGNVAIEYESRGKPSGISTTKSNMWVQYFDESFNIVETEVLKEQLQKIAFRDVTGGDPGSNTKMYLIKKGKFKKICKVIL